MQTKQLTNTTLLNTARQIDTIAKSAIAHIDGQSGFEGEIQVALAIEHMRHALTDEIMTPVMALMNTELGFRTDRDPNKINEKTGKPYTPYSVEVVRECFIESRLRGFHVCGNEWNILAERFYAAKNGLRRKVTRFPALTQFKDTYEVPRIVGDKGAIVKARATWMLNGIEDELEREIPVKVNGFMGTDAILGKAERKLLKFVLDRLTGTSTPEGEAGEEITVLAEPVSQTPPRFTPKTRTTKAAAPSQPEPNPRPEPQSRPASSPSPDSSASSAPASESERIQGKLAEFLTDAGVSFEDFRKWLGVTGRCPDVTSLASMDDVPTAVCESLLRTPSELAKCVLIFGTRKAAQ